MNKSAHYQNARYYSAEVPGLHAAMTAIHTHGCITLVSREAMFSIFFEQARRRGQPVTTARLTAAGWMLDTLNDIARRVTAHA